MQPAPLALKRRREEDEADERAAKRRTPVSGAQPAALDSVADENLVVRHYELCTLAACRDLGFDRAIASSAVVFLKRFFLTTSVLEVSPKDMV